MVYMAPPPCMCCYITTEMDYYIMVGGGKDTGAEIRITELTVMKRSVR